MHGRNLERRGRPTQLHRWSWRRQRSGFAIAQGECTNIQAAWQSPARVFGNVTRGHYDRRVVWISAGWVITFAVAALAVAGAARKGATRRRVLIAAAAAAAPVALLWTVVQADPLAIAGIAATTGAIAAWLRRWWSSGGDWVAPAVLAIGGLSLNLAALLVAALGGK